MRLAILASLMLTALAAATGCGASGQAHQPATPASAVAETPTDDPSWTPPDQMKLAIGEGKSAQTKTDLASTMPTPNKHPSVSGAVHAAY